MHGLATALAVMRKDLRDFLNNRALLLSLCAAVGMAIVFARLAERAQTAVRLVMTGGGGQMLSMPLRANGFEVQQVATRADVEAEVRAGRADFGVVVPEGFGESLARGEQPNLVMIEGDESPRMQVGRFALLEVLRVMAGQKLPVGFERYGVGSDGTAARVARMQSGWLLFVFMMGMTMVAASLVEERERGTWQAMLVTRASPVGILAGKGLGGFLLILAAAVALVAGSRGLVGEVAPKVAMLAAGAAFAAAFGLWMGTLFPNLAAANAGLSVVFLSLFAPVFMADALHGSVVGDAWTRLLPSHGLHDGLVKTFSRETGSLHWALGSLGAWTALSAAASWMWMRRSVPAR